MSEAKSFMQQLDAWTQTTIIDPLAHVADEQLYNELVEQIKKPSGRRSWTATRTG